MRIVLAFNEANGLFSVYALSGGDDGRGIASEQIINHFKSQPVEIRVGDITQTDITPIQIIQIAVMPDVAATDDDFNSIYQNAYQNNP